MILQASGRGIIVIASDAHLVLDGSLNVEVTQSNGYGFQVKSGVLDIDGATITSSVASSLVAVAGGTVNIFAGALSNANEAGNVLTGNSGSITFKPTGTIVCTGIIHQSISGRTTIVPQDGFVISSVKVDDKAVDIGSETYTFPDSTAISNLAIMLGGTTTATYTAFAVPSVTEANIDDTFTVTAKLTPSAAADFASGAVKFGYDTSKLTCIGATVSSAIENCQQKNATYSETDGTATVSFNTASGSELAVTDAGLELATFTFKAKAVGDADFIVSADSSLSLKDKSGDETVAAADKVTVTVKKAANVTAKTYASDYSLVKYVADAAPGADKAYYFGDELMTLVTGYGDNTYVALVKTANLPTDLAASLSTKDYAGGNPTISDPSGDANKSGKTNITDAQVMIYMLAAKFDSSTDGLDWLNSDVNGDGVIDALDAQAVQYYVHYGQFAAA